VRWIAAALVTLSASACGLTLDLSPPEPDAATSRDGGTGEPDGASRADGAPPTDARSPEAGLVDGSDGADASADAGRLPPECGGPTTLQDDFGDGVRDRLWGYEYVSSGVTITEGSTDDLRIRPPSRVGDSFGAYGSTFAVDLRGSHVAVRVPRVLEPHRNGRTFLELLRSDRQYLSIGVAGDQLVFSANDGTTPSGGSTMYAPETQWWRIREDDGNIHFETSPDASTWATHLTWPTPRWASAVWMEIGAGTTGYVEAPGEARFDDFNLDPPVRMRSPHCPASSFSDDFEDDGAGPSWVDSPNLSSGGCTVSDTGTAVRFVAHADGGRPQCFRATARGYDLRGEAAWIHVPEITDYTPELTFAFGVFTRPDPSLDASAQMVFQDGMLHVRTPEGTRGVAYTGEPYWRIRESAGMLHFEVSSDASRWDVVAALPSGFDASAVGLGFGMASLEAVPRDIGISVLGFNTP